MGPIFRWGSNWMQVCGTFEGFCLSSSFRLVKKNRPLNYIETTTLTLSRRLFPNNIPIKHQTSGGMTGCLEMAFFLKPSFQALI